MGARLISVTGVLQNEKGVIHVVGDSFEDLTPLLRRLSEHGAHIDPSGPTDEIKRPVQGSWRHPRSSDSFARLTKSKPAIEQLAAVEHAANVMPKGRNFH